jgi:hypothetical protein
MRFCSAIGLGLLIYCGLSAKIVMSFEQNPSVDSGTFKLTVAPVGSNNPRNSEAAITALKSGALLLGWTEFQAGSGADHGPARISGKVSTDGGRNWG